jgi:hypothetical protein
MFIEITDKQRNRVALNTDHIVKITAREDGCSITMSGINDVTTTLSIDEVMALMGLPPR